MNRRDDCAEPLFATDETCVANKGSSKGAASPASIRKIGDHFTGLLEIMGIKTTRIIRCNLTFQFFKRATRQQKLSGAGCKGDGVALIQMRVVDVCRSHSSF